MSNDGLDSILGVGFSFTVLIPLVFRGLEELRNAFNRGSNLQGMICVCF